jgi:iron complex outermembrane recepter protein
VSAKRPHRNTPNVIILQVIGGAALHCTFVGSALAQETDPQRVLKDRLEEVVVTAQHRSESIQDVPIAISAYSKESILALNMEDMWDVLSLTPGFSGGSGGTWMNAISVRGIRTNDFGVGGDTSMGLFKDGVYQGRQGGAVTSFYDMERAEALRGPQNFLYGRNAISGAINQITNKPQTDGFDAFAEMTVGKNDLIGFEGMLNVPLDDTWALRVAGRDVKVDGFIRNLYDGEKVGDFEATAFRASLARYGEKTDFTLIGEYEKRRGGGAIYWATNHNNILTNVGFSETTSGRVVNTDAPGFDESDIFSLTALVDVDVGFATFSSVTGYRTHEWDYMEDNDGTPRALYTWMQNQDVDNFSQDFRLVSTTDGPLSWSVGFSGYTEKIKAGMGSHSEEDAVCLVYFGQTCADRYGTFNYLPDGMLELTDIESDNMGYGIFASLSYAVTDKLDVDLGLRYSYDEKDFSIGVREITSELGPFMNFVYWSNGLVNEKRDWSDTSPRVAARYALTDDVTLWASYTNGYKAGGFSSFTLNLPTMEELGWTPEQIASCPWGNYCVLNADFSVPEGTRPQAFDPETVDSYEVGVKVSLLDDRLWLDLNAFYYEYEDMQLRYWDSELFNLVVENVGEVKGRGVEGTMSAKVNQYLSVQLAGSWMKTEVRDVPLQICNCEGNKLSQQPDVVLTGFALFNYPTEFGEFQANTNFRYQDKVFGALSNQPHNEWDSFTQVSARVGLKFSNGWGAWLFGDNLLDEVYYTGGTDGGYPFPQLVFGASQPRSFGLIVRYEHPR